MSWNPVQLISESHIEFEIWNPGAWVVSHDRRLVWGEQTFSGHSHILFVIYWNTII